MDGVESGGEEAARLPADLGRAIAGWVEHGNAAALLRWFEREAPHEGVPSRRPVPVWWASLEALWKARERRREAWPEALDARIERLLEAALRFARGDGSAVFGPGGTPPGRGRLIRDWLECVADPALETVARWWFPGSYRGRAETRGRRAAAPPVPAFALEGPPLAMLRGDWNRQGDLLAIDQRGPECQLDLTAGGRRWLGPRWGGHGEEAMSRARRTFWTSTIQADLFEWSIRRGQDRIVRSALLIPGRKLALLAEQVEGPGAAAELRVELAPGVTSAPIPERGSLRLSQNEPKSLAVRVLPLALPAADRGRLRTEGGELVLPRATPGRRVWLPLLVSWDGLRDRNEPTWRVLTVTERSRVCGPEVAFAVRVAWGRGESLILYRSLAKPAERAFLGHQTGSRFLVGVFTREGLVEPLLKVD